MKYCKITAAGLVDLTHKRAAIPHKDGIAALAL